MNRSTNYNYFQDQFCCTGLNWSVVLHVDVAFGKYEQFTNYLSMNLKFKPMWNGARHLSIR